MAVYTDVAAEDLAAFLAGYDIGELLAYKGIAEGVENSNFLVHTSRGYFILTLYEKRVAAKRPAVLPRPDGASARTRHHLPAAGEEQAPATRSAASPAARRRSITFLDGMWIRRPTAQPLRGAGRGAGAAASRRARFRHARGPTRCRSRAGAPLYEQAARAPNEVQRDLAERIAARAGAARSAPGRATCRRASSMPTCSPTTCSSSATSSRALIDFYFACTDALAYDVADLPQCLVLRDRPVLQPHQGQGLLQAYAAVRPLSERGDAARCRCSPAARPCASC